MSGERPTLAVLAACHNRRMTTLAGLAALRAAAGAIRYRVTLVDDGSCDGTSAAVAATFPEVRVIAGGGDLYWNGGMRAAWQAALADRPAYFLWWNDDLRLLPGSLVALLAHQRQQEAVFGPRVITVGRVADPVTGATTYGGYVRARGLSRLRFRRMADAGGACATANGNCVLIPAHAVDEIGINAARYTHAMGDVDYGLRAVRAGYRLFQAPDVVGHTPANDAFRRSHARLTWANRRFIFRHPKGIPLGEWLHFCRAHGGWLWPVNFVVRYLKIARLTG